MTCFHRIAPSVLSTFVMEDLDLSTTQMGLISSAYFYTYAVMQPPCGVLADRLGPRMLL
ncbi:major facilitator superfamily protein, partial [Kipferlia bialata]|eukprot:g14949.t1